MATTQATTGRPTVGVPRNFRVDEDKWQRFGDVATANGRDRGGQLRYLIDQAIAEHEGKPLVAVQAGVA